MGVGLCAVRGLLYADDVILLLDLQLSLKQFSVESEVAGRSNSASRSESKRKRVDEVLPQEEEFKSSGLYPQVREEWNIRLTGGSVRLEEEA